MKQMHCVGELKDRGASLGFPVQGGGAIVPRAGAMNVSTNNKATTGEVSSSRGSVSLVEKPKLSG